MIYDFYKENPTDRIWWVDMYNVGKKANPTPEELDRGRVMGALMISFDKKKVYNLWQDYPHNMTKEEVELFDKENPFWTDFFKDRKTAKPKNKQA